MSQRLDEVLSLSRIGRVVNPPDELAFATLAEEAVQSLAQRIEETGVQVRVAPDLPVVRGDRSRLLEVLQNLLENALKFMGEQPVSRMGSGVVPARAEINLIPVGKSFGTEFPVQSVRGGTGMHAHIAEIRSETGFHSVPGFFGKGNAAGLFFQPGQSETGSGGMEDARAGFGGRGVIAMVPRCGTVTGFRRMRGGIGLFFFT
jgi:hypothetical protein